MTVLGELNELLNRIPLWKELGGLPARVRALEEKLARLEGGGKTPARPAGEPCPICDTGTLKTIKVEPDPVFGDMGLKQHTLRCENGACAHTETRQVDPSKR